MSSAEMMKIAGPRNLNLTFEHFGAPKDGAAVNSWTLGHAVSRLQDIELPLTAKGVAFVESLGRVGPPLR